MFLLEHLTRPRSPGLGVATTVNACEPVASNATGRMGSFRRGVVKRSLRLVAAHRRPLGVVFVRIEEFEH